MKYVHVSLPRDRAQKGIWNLYGDDNKFPIHTCFCLGKADNDSAREHGNPSRDPTGPWGDTPTGMYVAARFHELPAPYGHMGQWIIPLVGCSGQAAIAAQAGRSGLAVHGGRGNDRLIPTNGCVRLLDRDLMRVHELVGTDVIQVEVADAE